MSVRVAISRNKDGRWRAEVPALPGVLVYAADEADATEKARAVARHVLAEHRELARDGLIIRRHPELSTL